MRNVNKLSTGKRATGINADKAVCVKPLVNQGHAQAGINVAQRELTALLA
jgi:hypothetical protein